MLIELQVEVTRMVEMAIRAARENDEQAAWDVVNNKSWIEQQVEQLHLYQAERLATEDERRPEIFRLEMSLVNSLKRIYNLSKRMARLFITPAVGSSSRAPDERDPRSA